jgi:N-acetylglucosaminyldiphosphoundecaprenol N-acetyl-beta-D-mannosaminyltransferase
MTLKVQNVRVDPLEKGAFYNRINSVLQGKTKFNVFKINTEFLVRTQRDYEFSMVLNSSDMNIPDGRGVQWAARYLTLPITDNKFFKLIQAIWQMVYSGAAIVLNSRFIKYPVLEVLPGIEALKLMLSAAEKVEAGVFFFGSSDMILQKAASSLQKQFPDLRITGMLNGYDYQKNNSIDPVALINKTDAKLLIVALGSPRQEYWIHDNLPKLKNIRVAVGEGGTLDRIANPLQKTPRIINRLGLEWLWRFVFNKSQTETRNRLQRVWNAVPVFIYEVVKWKIKNGAIKVE